VVYAVNLSKAFRLSTKEVVAFVGAGGKTMAMYRLADELAKQGKRTVITTTAKVYPPTPEQADRLIVAPNVDELLARLGQALRERQRIVAAANLDERDGKLIGIAPDLVARIAALPQVDATLVEADGSKGHPIKAPAEHEPPVPPCTTLLVPMAGLDAVGQPLSDRVAHRPERVAAIAGIEPGAVITPQVVAAVLVHRDGGLRNAPSGVRVVALLNKSDDKARLEEAWVIARLLLTSAEFESVVVGAMTAADPVREVWSRVAAVVLAAGESRRFGVPKQLLPWGATTLLGHVLDVVLAAGLDPVVVVVGCEAERVSAAVEGRPVRVVVNARWAEGLSASVRAGFDAIDPQCGAALFVLADQPGITREVIAALVQRHRQTLAPIVVPTCRGQRGTPVLFDRAMFGELVALEGDQGGRVLIERHSRKVESVEVADDGLFIDIDTPEDYQRYRG
jgi:molybdenum cofactor cytidylyltransferase